MVEGHDENIFLNKSKPGKHAYQVFSFNLSFQLLNLDARAIDRSFYDSL